jgi:hypothetical protein
MRIASRVTALGLDDKFPFHVIEVRLQRLHLIGERVTTSVAQHVRVYFERELGRDPSRLVAAEQLVTESA